MEAPRSISLQTVAADLLQHKGDLQANGNKVSDYIRKNFDNINVRELTNLSSDLGERIKEIKGETTGFLAFIKQLFGSSEQKELKEEAQFLKQLKGFTETFAREKRNQLGKSVRAETLVEVKKSVSSTQSGPFTKAVITEYNFVDISPKGEDIGVKE